MTKTCVQCQEVLTEVWIKTNIEIYYCDNSQCPNYGLYQIGEETND